MGASIQVAELFGRLGLKVDRKAWAEGTKMLERMRDGLARMARRAAIATAGLGVGAVVLADKYTELENRIRQVAGSNEELNALMDRTRAIANATRSDWKSTGEAFVRLKNATKDMGVSTERALAIVETLNMALQSSGASASEAAGGTLQLMQGLASGALQGDEFRSIAESLPDLLDLFAKELGVSRGELKKLGSEGKITSKVVVAALENASDSIRGKFAASTATAGQRWVQLKNSLMLASAEFMRATGFGEALGRAVARISDWIEGNRDKIRAFGAQVGAAFGMAYDAVAAVVTFLLDHSDLVTSALITLGGVMAGFAVKAAVAWAAAFAPVAVMLGALTLVVLAVRKVVKNWEDLKGAVQRSLRRTWEAIKAFGRGLAAPFVVAARAIRDAFEAAIEWVADKVQWVADKVEGAVNGVKKAANAVKEFFTGGDWSAVPGFMKRAIGAQRGGPDAPAAPRASAGPTSAVSVGGIKIDVHAAAGMNEQDLAVNVGKQVKEQLRTAFRHVGAERGVVG